MPDFQDQTLVPGALAEEAERLIAENKTALANLARQGAQIDPASLLNLRIDTLAELVLSEPGMLQFRLRFEQRVAEAINEIRAQLRTAQLAAGAYVPPRQVDQMARAQGLLGPDGQPARR
jgi:hypothetical protein